MSGRRRTKHFDPNGLGKWRTSLRASDLNTRAKCVGFILSFYANGSMLAWPGRQTLAADASMSVRSVDRALADLETAGLLNVYPPKKRVAQTRNGSTRIVEQRTGGRKKTNEYTLTPPATQTATAVHPFSETATAVQETATATHENGDTHAPELAIELEKELAPKDRLSKKEQSCALADCNRPRRRGTMFCREHFSEVAA